MGWCTCRGTFLVLAFLFDAVGTLIAIFSGSAGGGGFSLSGQGVATAFLLAGRVLGISFLSIQAVRVALGRWPRICTGQRSGPAVNEGARDLPLLRDNSAGLGIGGEGQGPTPGRAPLLDVGDSAAAQAVPSEQQVLSGDDRSRQIDEAVSVQREQLKQRAGGLFVRDSLLVVSYIFIAICSVRIACLVVALDFSESSAVASAVAQVASLFMMNLEFILVRSWVMELTAGDPIYMKGTHEHALYWVDVEGKGYAQCSRCNEKLGAKVGGYLTLQCRNCEPSRYGHGGFQICTHCYRKLAVKQGESGDKQGAGGSGILVGDKGPKVPKTLTVFQFVTRLASAVNVRSTAVCLLSVILAQVVNVYIPKAQGDCVNALVKDNEGEFYQRMQVFVVFLTASSLLGFVKSISVSTLNTRMYCNMSVKLFRSMLSQDIAFYDNAMTGQLNSRLTNDLRQAVSPVNIIVNSFVGNTVQLVAGFAICLHSSWRLTLLAFTCLSPVIHITREFSMWASKLLAAQYTYLADAQGAATQALTNVRTVRAFGALDIELGKYQEHAEKSMNIGLRSAWGMGFSTLLSDAVQQGASLIILYYGGGLALGHNGFDVGSIITFSYLWNTLSNAFQGLLDNMNVPIKAMSAGQRVFEILDLEPDIPENVGDGFPMEREQVKVLLKDLEFSYQSRPGKQVLNKVTLIAEAGKTTAVVGKSGCGKSTITKLLLRFYDPQGGNIFINDKNLRDMHVSEYRNKIGFVSQDTQLFRCTAFENITYGLPVGSVTQAEVERAALLANADEFIRTLPEGYKTMIGEGGHDLSGGQKQRLSIARALVRRPRVLLLDEATSALDAENEALVQEALDKLMKEMQGTCTIIVIAHRLSTIREADHIVVLHEGEKSEEGTHDELLQRDGRYAALTLRQRQDGTKETKDGGDGEPGVKSAKQIEEDIAKMIKGLPEEQQGEVLKGLFTVFKSAMMKR